MPERKDQGATQPRPSERIRNVESVDLNLPVIGHVRVPRADRLAFYGGLAALTTIQLLDWPVALLLGAGQALAENRHSRIVRQFGDALDDA